MAKSKESNTSEQLQELIAERQRYETWLAAIAIRRDSAPEHVVARVEQDYKGRLARIREELAARAGELRERIDSLSEQLAEIRLHEAARRDERAEAELRASVGELSPGQWAEVSENADAAISEYEANRKVLERDLAQLEQILSTVTWSETSGPPAASPSAAGGATKATRPASQAPAPAAAASAGKGSSSGSAAAASAPAPSSARPSPPAPPSREASGGSSSRSAAAEPAAEDQPAPATRSQSSKPGPETQRRKDPSQRQGQEKTLMCSECGTANYSTEWYCEACGAELSSL